MRYLPLLLCLAACGYAPGSYECSAAPFTVTADYPLNCEVMREDVALVRSILGERAIVPDAEFDRMFGGQPVVVRNFIYLERYADDTVRTGFYHPNGVIELSYNAVSFLHECLHHVDHVRLYPLSYWHEGWEGRGWNAASDDYDARHKSPSFDANGPLTVPTEPTP